MVKVGAHVSISDGFDSAVEENVELGGSAGQIFMGSPQGWSVKEVDGSHEEAFQDAHQNNDQSEWIVHGKYLINFATPKDDLGEKSVTAVQEEIDACATLGIPFYVFHPGSHTGAGVDGGIENVAERLSELEIPDETTVLLENTTGKGTSLGQRFKELDEMVQNSSYTYDELGVCLDTCHLYAGGYDFTDGDSIEQMVEELDEVIGVENVHYIHLNDSLHEFASEKDEHAHIGEGEIGEEGFVQFLNHDAFSDLPMVLETPVDSEKGYGWNVERIKELAAESA